MSEVPAANENPEPDEGIPTSDPYPKMILICMGIFVVLLIVIFGFILLDIVDRSDDYVRPISHPAPALETPPAS